MSPILLANAIDEYRLAREVVLAAGYGEEIKWQGRQDFDLCTEQIFLREAAWVVLAAGISEKVVRRKFGLLSLCFCDWCSAIEIVEFSNECTSTALKVFGNERKIQSIFRICEIVANEGFATTRLRVKEAPIATLAELPGIGPITAFHLSKNLGFQFAKEDRHLKRMASVLGFKSAKELCSVIAELSGDIVPVVDIILWRYCTLRGPKSMKRS